MRVQSAICCFIAVIFLTPSLFAADQTIRIAYPAEDELIQLGEGCTVALQSQNGWSQAKRVEYLMTPPDQQEKIVHTEVRNVKAPFTFPPFQNPGPHTLGIRVTTKDGNIIEDAVQISVGNGQYKYWPEYHYTELSDLKEITPEPWLDHDHIKKGWDWSLPDFVTPAPSSALGLERRFSLRGRFNKPEYQFKVNAVGSLWVRWRDLEPEEGKIDFVALEQVLRDAKSKGVDVALRILFSRRGKITGHDPSGAPQFDTSRASAPDWLADKGIKQIYYDNGEVDYDQLDPLYHSYYTRLVKKLGESPIPDLTARAYVGYASESHGDEYIGPEVPNGADPAELYPVVKERLEAWAEAFKGQTNKVYTGGPSRHAFNLGFGVRRGFVEKYLYEIPDQTIGSFIDPEGYLTIDETAQIHAESLTNGEENEEYEVEWTESSRNHRFGYTTTSFPYRYFVSSLRMLQMRCNDILTGSGHLIKGMLPFIALQLGRTVNDTPDVWCYLNTSHIRSGYYKSNDFQDPPRPLSLEEKKRGYIECRNFERWLHQRDEPGYETEPRIKVNQPRDMWMVPADKPYDHIARGGQKIGFHIDDRWLALHHKGRLAVKVTFIDSKKVKEKAPEGTLTLNFRSAGKDVSLPAELTGDAELRTATFFISDLDANAMDHGFDFTLEAGNNAPEIVVSMVRVIRADDPAI